MEKDKLEAAAIAMSGVADEAKTIEKYTRDLQNLLELMPEAEEIYKQYREIISDELNHIERFCEIYVNLTGIAFAED